MKNLLRLLALILMVMITSSLNAKPKWVSLFNGKDLTGWLWKHGSD